MSTRILVVEDQADNRRILRDLMHRSTPLLANGPLRMAAAHEATTSQGGRACEHRGEFSCDATELCLKTVSS